ncbi:LysR family transcriptional regulator [Klebsiella quasipneumoniae]|uniref:LysR family transcriptional regulator n=1 Tax=Klebsiella quasipneumoniae TaxID=1463165 RepID=UPI0010344E22|nr:LysR family transcriptional regulator [Klebsiella quasipneumoniae]HBT4728867.1 LysR family transcriptional regulator [Klebsiella quasipneumoniae subsp. similipneumoniae]EIY4986500.1 LysR family transcriptional regulator [Klebsiella quasipneumoniae]EIY5073186.1 LysR family transcriptional regulator [Klebsiella quasipneumoniae]ELA0828675.1 LysR family transcriptional regulator [Klebsiella quasipneumoniae]MBG2326995.1 LysR family transcriptional regulator [Klebsiella quasipneumoniae]
MAKRENYNDLYLFMQVVREGSFTAAAQRLGLAQSGISRAVRELEERLGVQLLVRTTRRLSLTQAGEQLYHNVESGFDALDMGLATLAHYRQTPSGTVRINASQHAIDKVLLPKLAIFKQRYPDIRLELITERRFVDIIAERFDAGVRLGPEVGSGMIAVRISPDMEMAVVGTPEHFRRYGFPQTPADLTGHPCIAYQFGDGSLYAWELNVEGKKITHPPQGQWAFADSYMEAKAARLGLGLAYVPEELVTDDLQRGTLIRVLQRYSQRLEGSFLYYPHRNVSPALRAVIDTLRM